MTAFVVGAIVGVLIGLAIAVLRRSPTTAKASDAKNYRPRHECQRRHHRRSSQRTFAEADFQKSRERVGMMSKQ